MKEKPILFSAPMIRALLAGKKTQTRRLVKCPPIQEAPSNWHYIGFVSEGHHFENLAESTQMVRPEILIKPKYEVGDLLWVREGWRVPEEYDKFSPHDVGIALMPRVPVQDIPIDFKATAQLDEGIWGRWRSSLHMPRWASRITLKVTGVKVERVQSISREDAAAEGICYLSEIGFDGQYKDRDGYKMNVIQNHRWPEENFGHLWMMINSYDSWDRNDWVFAYEFEVQP